MAKNHVPKKKHSLEVPSVEFAHDDGGLPLIKIRTPSSTAEIYLQGAQVTRFQKNGEPPLLFLSAKSQFTEGTAIRGGVPICFPWFGARTGEPSHGFARTSQWELVSISSGPNQAVIVRMRLPEERLHLGWAGLQTEFTVTISDTLTMELVTINETTNQTFEIENCLHTYFRVGDIHDVTITGLQGASYLDNATDGYGVPKKDNEPALRIVKETNRIYTGTMNTLEIADKRLNRTIRVEKFHSHSTVVWNPWTTQLMADFDPAEHRQMVCVEAGNVRQDRLDLAPGTSSTLRVRLESSPLK
jgi:D-hexose-6-phosphate mutarotase